MINQELKKYIEKNIIPNYGDFDKGHSFDHVNTVIEESLQLLQNQSDLKRDMVYTIAAYHDLGLSKDRKTHHIVSGEILLADKTLKNWFSDGEILIMKEAVEDHRASATTPPRSIYGKIIAEADRAIEPESILRRTIQYSMKNTPSDDKEVHYNHVVEHMAEKYAEGGYLKLWFEQSKNAQKLEELRAIIKQPKLLRETFERLYKEEISSLIK